MKNFFILFSFTLSLSASAYTPGKVYQVTILHTNDNHGRFWQNKKGEYGMPARATLIREIREEVKRSGGHVLLLDAGDVNTGVPQSDLLDAEPDFKAMKLLGYDAMAIGNHEFDNRLSVIHRQQKWAGFPFLSANIYNKSTKNRIFPSDITKNFDGLKITIFGLTTEDTPYKTNPENIKNLFFRPAVEEAKTLVPELKKRSDIIIAVTHCGHYPNEKNGSEAPGDVTIARQAPGIDVIVGGHTQKPLFEPDVQNGTAILQAYEWGKYLGRADLEFLDGKTTVKKYQLIPVNLQTSERKIIPDAKVEKFLKPFKTKGDGTLLRKIGTADAEFVGHRGISKEMETALGNLIARAYRDRVKSDFSIANGGSIRDSLSKGTLTYESVLMALPFGNEIVTVTMKGSALRHYLQELMSNLVFPSGGYPQLDGLELVVDRKTHQLKVVKVNAVLLDDERYYTMALPDFLARGGDKYPKIDFIKSGSIDAEIVKTYIEKLKHLKMAEFAPRGSLRFE